MSGQSLSRRRQLSTKQWSENKCIAVPTKIQLRVTRWIIGTGRVKSDGMSVKHAAAVCTRLTARFSQTVKPFWRFILSIFCSLMYPFFFKIVHYFDKTESLSTCHIFTKLLFCCQFCWRQLALIWFLKLIQKLLRVKFFIKTELKRNPVQV